MNSSQTWLERLSFPCLMVKLRLRETRHPCMKLSLSLEQPKDQGADVRMAPGPAGAEATLRQEGSPLLFPSHTTLGHSAHLLCR